MNLFKNAIIHSTCDLVCKTCHKCLVMVDIIIFPNKCIISSCLKFNEDKLYFLISHSFYLMMQGMQGTQDLYIHYSYSSPLNIKIFLSQWPINTNVMIEKNIQVLLCLHLKVYLIRKCWHTMTSLFFYQLFFFSILDVCLSKKNGL